MNEERKVTREGIHIDRDVADAVAIEEDLDSNLTGPYQFPDPRRRLVSAGIYLATAIVVAVVVHPLPAVGVLALAAWHALGAWSLKIDQTRALDAAAAAIDFSVGHASAAVGFHGLRARPRWSVILYSAAEPPDRRALVTVDGVSGIILADPFVEEIPGL